MDLIILRHGEAGKSIPVASKDFERTLTAAGKKEVEEIARSLKRLSLSVDRILTSPLKRAEETAQIVARELGRKDVFEEWSELKPEGDRDALYRKLSKFRRESSIMLVGHEPYLSTMISELISGDTRSRISLKKAGMAKVEVTSFSPHPAGELRWLLTPRQIRKLS